MATNQLVTATFQLNPLRCNFSRNVSDQISVIGSYDGPAVLKIEHSASQNTVAITLWADATTGYFLGGGENACFHATLYLQHRSDEAKTRPYGQKSLSGFSLKRRSRLILLMLQLDLPSERRITSAAPTRPKTRFVSTTKSFSCQRTSCCWLIYKHRPRCPMSC